jgi:N-formylglutamate amidohydrolase
LDRNLLPPPAVIMPRSLQPVVLSIPHSGRDYPEWLLSQSVDGRSALESLEDPLIDRLAWRALQTGIGAVIARAPRAAIDCNRAAMEVDPHVIADAKECGSNRARAGLGIIPGRTSRFGNLWRQPVDQAELDRRITAAHAPYHRAIERDV